MSETNHYYGKDCPVGMVQVEFVGCDPKAKSSEYGWKPCKSTFIEVYVDGQRFRIDVGDLKENGVNARGIHINGPMNFGFERTALNACCIYITEKTAPQEKAETASTDNQHPQAKTGEGISLRQFI